MRYSFDEVKQNKSIVIVDTEDMSITTYALHPSQTLEKYQGTYQQFMDPSFIQNKNDYLSFELEDDSLIPHAIDKLRVLYPNLLQITYTFYMKQQNQISHQSIQTLEETDMKTLFAKFYQEMKNQELNNEQIQVVNELLERAGEDHENH
jgi:exonuclease SbcD